MRIETARGAARVDLDDPAGQPRCLLVLTHGAGGGVDAADLLAVRDAAVDAGVAVARVTQPYRLAGRRMPGRDTVAQDESWRTVVRAVRERYPGVALVVGGRSNGARVACRTAADMGARAVVALAFPLHPPKRPERSRVDELRGADVPTLVVNGDRDPFGVPDPADATTLEVRPGERHDLAKDPEAVAGIVVDWVTRHTG